MSGKDRAPERPVSVPLTRQLSESEIEELRQDMAEASLKMKEALNIHYKTEK